MWLFCWRCLIILWIFFVEDCVLFVSEWILLVIMVKLCFCLLVWVVLIVVLSVSRFVCFVIFLIIFIILLIFLFVWVNLVIICIDVFILFVWDWMFLMVCVRMFMLFCVFWLVVCVVLFELWMVDDIVCVFCCINEMVLLIDFVFWLSCEMVFLDCNVVVFNFFDFVSMWLVVLFIFCNVFCNWLRSLLNVFVMVLNLLFFDVWKWNVKFFLLEDKLFIILMNFLSGLLIIYLMSN